jgi:hypothetical protein
MLLEARNRVFARHPETRFVSLHIRLPLEDNALNPTVRFFGTHSNEA